MPSIIEKAEAYATELLTKRLRPEYLYHNITHTKRVVKSTKELASFYGLDDKATEVLLLAAWLHDTGYVKGSEAHEDKSSGMAHEFLIGEGYAEADIEKVKTLIMATKRFHEPQNLEEQIIRDADASHFAQKSYAETTELLRQELDLLGIAHISSAKWCKKNIDMLQKEHQYYTEYAQEHWRPKKLKNIEKLMSSKKEEKIAKKEAIKAKFKTETPERSVQTMYRVAMSNHLKLSDIADTKANILLSVNAIIISLVLSNLIPKLDNPSNTYLIYPTLIFTATTLASMILSVVATRPNITEGRFSKDDVSNGRVNLLFFGNFHQMSLEDYEWAMQELVKNKDYVYSSLTKDLYFLGKVLDRKYRILRITYAIFMTGIIISVFTFGIAFRLSGKVPL